MRAAILPQKESTFKPIKLSLSIDTEDELRYLHTMFSKGIREVLEEDIKAGGYEFDPHNCNGRLVVLTLLERELENL